MHLNTRLHNLVLSHQDPPWGHPVDDGVYCSSFSHHVRLCPHRPFSNGRRRLYYLTRAACTLSDFSLSLSSLSSRSGHALVGRHTRWRALMKSDGQYIAGSILEMRDPSARSGIRRPPLPHIRFISCAFLYWRFLSSLGKTANKTTNPVSDTPTQAAFAAPLSLLFIASLSLSLSRRLL